MLAGHNGGFNLSFVDGHAKWYRPTLSGQPNVWDKTNLVRAPDEKMMGLQLLEQKYQ